MPTVAILTCTYQGARYLAAQIDSIVAQTHRDWFIVISDDGSTDDTRAILAGYQERLGADRVHIVDGPCGGFAANFFSLVQRTDCTADFYAFCDQDDEWEPLKLERAVAAMAQAGQRPMMYGSISELVDAQGRHLGYSRAWSRTPSFANALVQNIASGNTMVLNTAAMDLMRRARVPANLFAHDWWAYLLVTGCGGTMVFDHQPTIRYRQHGLNLLGSHVSLAARWTRLRRLFQGDFRDWNDANIGALRMNWDLLTEDSRRTVQSFAAAREAGSGSLRRLARFLRSGVHRQSWDGQVGLLVAAFAGKL